ncbi:unnamed protein product [Acanthoscelides obtectus]|nr:unnamed protein product [Acanthoscelides obtectus]CAK1641458.1 hypothetical protein AOBTE_LOCUS12418 [Acanthoscelides obtectus]
MKEALEQFTKSNQELVAKSLADEYTKPSTAVKRPREASIEMLHTEKSLMPAPTAVPTDEEQQQPPPKKPKDTDSRTLSPQVQALPNVLTTQPPQQQPTQQQPPSQQSLQQQTQSPPTPSQQPQHDDEGVDIEALLPPSTVVKPTGLTPEKKTATKEDKTPLLAVVPNPQQPSPTPTPPPAKENYSEDKSDESPVKATVEEQPTEAPSPLKEEPSKQSQEAVAATTVTASAGEGSDTSPPAAKKGAKRTRGKRKSGETIIDPESIVAKKNLRSSASRSAAAAAARQKLEAENAQRERNEENVNANS